MPDQLTVSEKNLPYMELQWYRVEGCLFYEVRQWTGAAWAKRFVVDENGSWVYSVVTGNLTDETEARFQIVAIDILGLESDPLEFKRFVVRPPTLDPTTIELTYSNSTHKITIAQV